MSTTAELSRDPISAVTIDEIDGKYTVVVTQKSGTTHRLDTYTERTQAEQHARLLGADRHSESATAPWPPPRGPIPALDHDLRTPVKNRLT